MRESIDHERLAAPAAPDGEQTHKANMGAFRCGFRAVLNRFRSLLVRIGGVLKTLRAGSPEPVSTYMLVHNDKYRALTNLQAKLTLDCKLLIKKGDRHPKSDFDLSRVARRKLLHARVIQAARFLIHMSRLSRHFKPVGLGFSRLRAHIVPTFEVIYGS